MDSEHIFNGIAQQGARKEGGRGRGRGHGSGRGRGRGRGRRGRGRGRRHHAQNEVKRHNSGHKRNRERSYSSSSRQGSRDAPRTVKDLEQQLFSQNVPQARKKNNKKRRKKKKNSLNINVNSANSSQNNGVRRSPRVIAKTFQNDTEMPDFTPTISSGKKKDFMTSSTFASLDIDTRLKRGLAEVMKYVTMTRVQEQTLPTALSGVDLLAQAKTGTGKTLGFLIPSIDNVLRCRQRLSGVSIIAISPTRELANQICTEASKLLYFHPNFKTCSMVGGTNKKTDIKRIKSGIDLLVATPGRLIDHLQSTPGFREQCASVKVLILDEADQMLEMGFRPDLTRIISYLPKDRQSLLFSATMPKSLMDVCKIAVKHDYKYINTIPKDQQQTHKKVPQAVVVAPVDQITNMVMKEISIEMQRHPNNFKVMIFFVTARLTGFMATLCRKARIPTIEMHSRKSQSYRTKAAKQFRDGTKLVLFTSDVSARGVDYPDVTLVMQVGMTEREPYILGRTARAASGVEGRGKLVLAPFESKFCLSLLTELPIQFETYVPCKDTHPEVFTHVTRMLNDIKKDPEMRKAAAQAYQAWIGFYNGYLRKLRWNKPELVRMGTEFARSINALDIQGNPPALLRRTVGKMGLKGIRGLTIVNSPNDLVY